MDNLENNLIQSIQDSNLEESIYWAHLLKQAIDLSSDSTAQLTASTAASLSIDQLFLGFGFGNDELSSLLCNLIWNSLKNEDYPVIIQKYRQELIEGLRPDHLDENVQKLCLRIVFELGIEIDHEILGNCLQLLITSNYKVSSYLISLLTKREIPLDHLISNQIIELYSKSRGDSVIQFRFFELFQKLNLQNSNEIRRTFFSDIKSILLDNSDDYLLIANGLQIISDCVCGRDQFLIFQIEGIIEIILNLVDSSNYFISSKSIDILANFALLNCFDFEFIDGLDRKLLLLQHPLESSLFCLAAFATISPNPQYLLKPFPENLVHGTTSIQLAAIHGLGIYFKSTQANEDEKLSILSQIISNIPNLFDWILEKVKSTFDEQKSAAYFLLKSILSSEICFKHVLNTTTRIFSTLLDRNSDDSMIGLKWKYGILEQVHSDPILFSSLNDPLKAQVNKYLGQGVTFVPKSTQVAFESAD